jgi:Fe-S oxidoreductase/nitrate reductase gamma subunit
MPADAPTLTREVFGNIGPIARAIFYGLSVASLACFGYGVYRRVRLWRLGRPDKEPFKPGEALHRCFTHVFSQRTVLRRGAASVAHVLLFSGFVVLFIGTTLLAFEHFGAAVFGREPTNPIFHKGVYFALYEAVLDTFGIALLVGCVIFSRRRLRPPASLGHTAADWAILGALFTLGVTGYLVEGLRIIREQTHGAECSFVGLGVARLLQAGGLTGAGASPLHFGLWWVHAVLALGLVAAFPYTRLLHALAGALNLAAFPKRLGAMTVCSMEELEQTGLVGVGKVQDFTRRQLLEVDACVSCGRCEEACPAFEAGKPLSPRDVVQDVRAHLEAIAPLQRASGASGIHAVRVAPSLHGDTIKAETLWSCTTCHACVEVCPLGVRPLEFITDLRRHLIAEAQLRGAPAASLQKLQRAGNPWGLPAQDRLKWATGLDVPTVQSNPNFDVLYWVGCAAAYEPRAQRTARSVVQLLKAARVNFAVLGPAERCTGETARRLGDEFAFQELAHANIETLTRHRVKKILTHCPHCLNSFKHDYAQFGGHYEVVHHTQFLAELVAQGRLSISPRRAMVPPMRVSTDAASQSRQVLDCGEGVCGVTALVSGAPEAPTPAAAAVRATESGDFADSVAALQDAGAPAEAHRSAAPPPQEIVTFHDPCYLARVNGVTEPPRELLKLLDPVPAERRVVEMPRHGGRTACCGAGGGRMWFDDKPAERIGRSRVEEALATGAQTIAVACPFCLTMMGDGVAAREASVRVRDIADLLAEKLDTTTAAA